MTNVTQHSTADGTGWTDSKISQGAIEGAQTKPSFWWYLQRAAQEITNDIGMANDNLKLVFASILLLLGDGP